MRRHMREAERKVECVGRSGKNGERKKYFPFSSKLFELLTMMLGPLEFFSSLAILLPSPDFVPAVPSACNTSPTQPITPLNPSFLSLRS